MIPRNVDLIRAKGAVLVYRFDGKQWASDGLIAPTQDRDLYSFGFSVALDGDAIGITSQLPGASSESDGSLGWSPVAHFYHRTPHGWQPAGEHVFTNRTACAGCGWIRLRGGVAVMPVLRARVVEVFERSASGWRHAATLTNPSGNDNSDFGINADTDGSVIAAVDEEFEVAPGIEGAVFLYRRQGGEWNLTERLDGVEQSHFFGIDMAIGGRRLVVADPRHECIDEYGRRSECGAVHLYSLGDADCNCNGTPDICEIESGEQSDCNANVIPDVCDLAEGRSGDCNADGVLDECENDCQENGVPDGCDIAAGTSLDCNGNVLPDECELSGPDCNFNGVDDAEELAGPRTVFEDDFSSCTSNEPDPELWTHHENAGCCSPNLYLSPPVGSSASIESRPIDLALAAQARLHFDTSIQRPCPAERAHFMEYWDGKVWKILVDVYSLGNPNSSK